jgi:parallel beta-helix repeat protein
MRIDRSGSILLILLSLLVSLLVSVAVTSIDTVEASDGGSWVAVSHSPGIFNYGVAVTGNGENIYIMNSSTSPPPYCKFWCYKPTDNSWETLAVPKDGGDTVWAKNGTCMAGDDGNYIYALFGGSYGDTGGDARYYFYRYSISDNSWERLENTPGGQGAGDAITWVPGSALGTQTDWIYAIVGAKWGSNQTTFCCYNIDSDSWETLTYNPSWSGDGSDDGSSLVWAGGDYLYALQGEQHETNENLDRAFARFDLTDNSWDDLPDIPEEGGVADGGSLVWVGGSYSDNIYALGGAYVGPGETPGDNFYCYSISENSWTQLESLPYGITDQNGPRLGYANENIYCWRGYYSASEGDPDVLWAYAVPEGEEGLVSRGPIHIVENVGFTPENGVNGGGSGTAGDPYIIENWDISAENENGIWIENTTAHFIIRNCRVHDGRDNNNFGILFENVVNGEIDNVVSDNNGSGIVLYWDSHNNTITNSIVKNNSWRGLWFTGSPNNYLRNNTCENNAYNFGVWAYDNFYQFYQDIDNSNEVNGKPIYYIIEQENLTFDGDVMDIGYLGLVSCENILVKNLNMSNVHHGVLLANTSYSTVTNCNFSNTWWSVDLNASSKNIIKNCTSSNNAYAGVALYWSDNNLVTNFIAEGSDRGIWLHNSYNNTIRDCTVENNHLGVELLGASDNNQIYHNNFVNNWGQAYDECSNYWDNGYPSGGNYWSDYTGVDADNDGIGDTPYDNILGDNNQDRYPLMEPWSLVESSDLHLVPGWNLISFPVSSESDTPENLFAGKTYSMWGWDPATGGYEKPPDDEPVEIGVGYWVYVEENMTVTTSGTPVETFEISLVADSWNLIGFPVTSESSTPENLLENSAYYSMWKWDPTTGGYVKPPDDEPVELGLGYWLITDENTIKVPY